MKLGTLLSDNDHTTCSFFAEFFKNAYEKSSLSSFHYPYQINSIVDLGSYFLNEEEILSGLNSIKVSFAPGPDGIPSSILKSCSFELYKPLTKLFNTSLKLGYFPNIWKNSYVIPLHKNNCKSDVCNYRPIAKLSAIPKTFEKLVTNFITFSINNYISPFQHGFRKNKSTVTNLLEFSTHVFDGFKHNHSTDVIYTDFSKAFDKVNHMILVEKLRLWGFNGQLLSWLSSYLIGRRQCILFKDIYSPYFTVSSGVPQGSHLGPLLFNLFINDLPDIIKYCKILMFADDIKIFLTHSNLSRYLQVDLDSFIVWCEVNCMHLNLNKCKHVVFSRCMHNSNGFSINGSPLETLDQITDLGVIMDRQLRFHTHINTAVIRAFSMLGFVKRWSKEFNDPYITKLLYTSLVRPILEYASIVWFPKYQVYIDSVESVQKQFLLFCLRGLNWSNDVHLPPYLSRLKLISLSSLNLRRKLHCSLFILKLLCGHVGSSFLTSNLYFNVPSRLTRNYNFLHVDYYKINYLNNNSLGVACLEFNGVYDIVETNLSIDINRIRIEEFLLRNNY